MFSQSEKGRIFAALHRRPGCFVIPNPWDAGSARVLASLGFEALATTSAGLAFTLARRDARGLVSRQEALANAAAIVDACALPVSADLENGYSPEPGLVADTIQEAAAAGLVGASIEDASGDTDDPIYALELAVERIAAAAEAARALPFPFMLTARAENYLYGVTDLSATIARLQAYQEAGADVLYAPGLRNAEDIGALVKAVDRPVNVVMGLSGVSLALSDLAALGVKRVSVGSALNRAAFGALFSAAREIRDTGTFTFASNAASMRELDAIFTPPFD